MMRKFLFLSLWFKYLWVDSTLMSVVNCTDKCGGGGQCNHNNLKQLISFLMVRIKRTRISLIGRNTTCTLPLGITALHLAWPENLRCSVNSHASLNLFCGHKLCNNVSVTILMSINRKDISLVKLAIFVCPLNVVLLRKSIESVFQGAFRLLLLLQ